MSRYNNYKCSRITRPGYGRDSATSDSEAIRSNLSGQNDSNTNVPNRLTSESSTPETTPTRSDGYTMIRPNESRRRQLEMTAQTEMEALQSWREAHRPGPVHVSPERLGGNLSLDEARQRQYGQSRWARHQKQIKKEEMKRQERQREEAEIQKKKDNQREKANRLEENRRQEEQRRREQLSQDHVRTNDSFLQKHEQTSSAPVPLNSATHTSSRHRAQEYRETRKKEESAADQLKKDEQRAKGKALEEKQRGEEEARRRELQLDHSRVNRAFLDRIQSQGWPREVEEGAGWGPSFLEDSRNQLVQSPGAQGSLSCTADQEQGASHWEEDSHYSPENPDPHQNVLGGEDDPEYEWEVMKLQSAFPHCAKAYLEDILMQCNGDYQQAHALLSD